RLRPPMMRVAHGAPSRFPRAPASGPLRGRELRAGFKSRPLRSMRGVSVGGTSRFPRTPSTGPLRGRALRAGFKSRPLRSFPLFTLQGEETTLAATKMSEPAPPSYPPASETRLRLSEAGFLFLGG